MSLPEVDTLIFFFINRDLQNRLFDVAMPFFTSKAYLLIFPFVGWFFYKDWKKACLVLVLGFASLALSDWGLYILKHIFERPRPCNELEGVHLLVGCSSSYSMPSSHAANSFAFAVPFLILFKNRLRYAFLIIAFLVSFSRIYVGVHYPSDSLVGGLVGIGLALCLIGFYNMAYERFKIKPYSTILFVFLLALSLFRIYYIQKGFLDLSPDEAHYWEWSRRLDLSYYSKGPMIAYLIYFGTMILGDNVFGIRMMAVIFSYLSSIYMYILGKKLYDKQVGLFSAILIQIIPLFSTFGIIFTIDSPFIFFWILSLFLFYLSIENSYHPLHSSNPPTPPFSKGGKEGFDSSRITDYASRTNHTSLIYWILLGFSVGFGLLTKYTMALFYLCAFLFLFLRERRLLLTTGPYIAFIISLLVFSPVLLWNADHEWVTLRHTAGQAHVAEGARIALRSFFEFVGSQFGVITPLLFILMTFSLWNQRKQKGGDLLFWFSIPIIAFFLLKSLQGKVQANWALPGYITGILSFSAFSKKVFPERKGKMIFIATAVLLSVVVTALAHYPSILNLPAKKDPTSRLRGWKELGSEVTKIYEEMYEGRAIFIFSDRYQVSSELAFYVKGHPITYCINLDRRMNQYDLWPGFHELLHHNAILVRIGDTKVPEPVASAFEKIEKRLFTVYINNEKIRDYSLLLCYDFKGMREEKPGTY
ncbi:MAG: glycosyltransferase family 39 protein [Nitrospirota bacterium]